MTLLVVEVAAEWHWQKEDRDSSILLHGLGTSRWHHWHSVVDAKLLDIDDRWVAGI
jgi:hypothetical protein